NPAPATASDPRSRQIHRLIRVTLVLLGLLMPLYLPFAIPSERDGTVGWSGTPLAAPVGDSARLLVTRTTWWAHAAGMLPGDVVLSVNGHPATLDAVARNHALASPAGTLRLVILRGGKQLQLDVPVVVSPPSYSGYLWYRFVLALVAWGIGMTLVVWRGERADALVLGAAMLLVAPVTLAVSLAVALPGQGPLLEAANALWHLEAGAYRFFFPALLLHFLVLNTEGPAPLRSRTFWLCVYLALLAVLFVVTDFFREPQAWRTPGTGQSVRTAAGLVVELVAAAGAMMVLRRIGVRRDSLRWLAFTALLFLLSGIPLSAAVLAPGASPVVVDFIRQGKSLMLMLLVAMAGLYIFTRGNHDAGQWDFRSRLAASASVLLTGLYGFAVAGAAALAHSLETRLGGIDGLLFITVFLAGILFSPVLRWAREMVDRQMFARWAELEVRTHGFVDRMSGELELDRIVEGVGRELPRLLDVSSARLVLAEELIGVWGHFDPVKLHCQRRAVLAEQIAEGLEGDDVIVPVYRPNGEILGVLRIGQRLYSQEFEPPEYAILRTLSQGVAAALRNAEAYLTLRRAQQELDDAERVASMGALASGLAHEIKNPLASLQMGLYLLEREHADSVKLQRIRRDARRIDDLVSGLLHYTHDGSVEASQLLDLRSIARTCVSEVRELAADRGARVVEAYPAGPAMLVAGPGQVRIVISNLLVNAIESVPEGGTVQVGMMLSDSLVELTVRDDGPGVPSELHERIFQLNFSTKPGGGGLGLALARRETERLGGCIEIASANGRGTLLRVTLPRAT
ncbi:MAG: BaeS, partial [Gemmatimonadetes bacterium]|nr:BaeS [Gemmatimonadota bacterium]